MPADGMVGNKKDEGGSQVAYIISFNASSY